MRLYIYRFGFPHQTECFIFCALPFTLFQRKERRGRRKNVCVKFFSSYVWPSSRNTQRWRQERISDAKKSSSIKMQQVSIPQRKLIIQSKQVLRVSKRWRKFFVSIRKILFAKIENFVNLVKAFSIFIAVIAESVAALFEHEFFPLVRINILFDYSN